VKWEEQDLKFEAEIPEPRRPAGTLSTERHARSDNEDGRCGLDLNLESD